MEVKVEGKGYGHTDIKFTYYDRWWVGWLGWLGLGLWLVKRNVSVYQP